MCYFMCYKPWKLVCLLMTFILLEIRRPRAGLDPRTSDLMAGMVTSRHEARFLQLYLTSWVLATSRGGDLSLHVATSVCLHIAFECMHNIQHFDERCCVYWKQSGKENVSLNAILFHTGGKQFAISWIRPWINVANSFRRILLPAYTTTHNLYTELLLKFNNIV